jgi:hypothetical protein
VTRGTRRRQLLLCGTSTSECRKRPVPAVGRPFPRFLRTGKCVAGLSDERGRAIQKAENCVGFVRFLSRAQGHFTRIPYTFPLEPSYNGSVGSFGHPVQVQPTSISNTTGAKHVHRGFYGHRHVTRPMARKLYWYGQCSVERGVVYRTWYCHDPWQQVKVEAMNTHTLQQAARRPREKRREEEATRGGGYTS